jgi:hypothetical protein
MRAPIFAIAISIGLGLVGCFVEPAPRKQPQPYAPQPTTTVPTTTPPSTTPPPKVAIDKGKTLIAQPGAGAGVFITYPGDGRWAIQWTCDTNYSGLTCPFDIAVGANNLSALVATPTNAVPSFDATGFHAHTDTGATLDSVQFSTDPGASITVSVFLRGAPVTNLVFFVSDGKLATEPTDPIELVPSAP